MCKQGIHGNCRPRNLGISGIVSIIFSRSLVFSFPYSLSWSITSDCGAVDCVYNDHHYTNTTGATCEVTLASGMDIECGDFLQNHLADAISSRDVPIEVVDASLLNLFVVQLRLVRISTLIALFKSFRACLIPLKLSHILRITILIRSILQSIKHSPWMLLDRLSFFFMSFSLWWDSLFRGCQTIFFCIPSHFYPRHHVLLIFLGHRAVKEWE